MAPSFSSLRRRSTSRPDRPPPQHTDATSLIPLIPLIPLTTCAHPAVRGRPPGQLTSHFLLHRAYNTAKPRDSSHSGLFDLLRTSAVTQTLLHPAVRKRTAFMSAPELGCRFFSAGHLQLSSAAWRVPQTQCRSIAQRKHPARISLTGCKT